MSLHWKISPDLGIGILTVPEQFTGRRVCQSEAERYAEDGGLYSFRQDVDVYKMSTLVPLPACSQTAFLQPVTMRFTQSLIATAAAAGVSAQEFMWTGTNQAGAEFGEDTFPGSLGEHYIWPEPESIDVRHASPFTMLGTDRYARHSPPRA